MSYLPEHKKYQRCETLVCKALASIDGVNWGNIDVKSISAGDMLFSAGYILDEDAKLYFNLYIYNMLSEFNIKMEGRIVRSDSNIDKLLYCVQFENMSKYERVQLDELIRSRITLGSTYDYFVQEQQDYSGMLFSQLRSGKKGSYTGNYR